MVDSDRGVRGVARRGGYVSWDDSSDCDGRGVSVVGDCDGGNGEGGGRDADGVGVGTMITSWTVCEMKGNEAGVCFWCQNGGGGKDEMKKIRTNLCILF